MKARFVSEDPTENRVCTFKDTDFPLNEWVDVSDELGAVLADMPPFEVDGGKKKAASV